MAPPLASTVPDSSVPTLASTVPDSMVPTLASTVPDSSVPTLASTVPDSVVPALVSSVPDSMVPALDSMIPVPVLASLAPGRGCPPELSWPPLGPLQPPWLDLDCLGSSGSRSLEEGGTVTVAWGLVFGLLFC